MDNPIEVPPLTNPTANSDPVVATERYQLIDPNNPAWGIGGALLVCLASIVTQIIVPLFFIIPFALYRGLNPTAPDFARRAMELSLTDPTGILLQIISVFPAHLLTFAAVWVVVTRFRKRPFLESLGWDWPRRLRPWQGIGLGIALYAISLGLVKLLGAEQQTRLDLLINSSLAARYAIAILAVFTAPFIEEFIYRGVLYSALQRIIGVKGAVVFVVGLFTLIHVPQYLPNVGIISAVALLSIVLTIVRAWSGRLLPCVVIHMVFNGVQAILLIVEPYAQRALTPTEPTVPAVSILSRLVVLLF